MTRSCLLAILAAARAHIGAIVALACLASEAGASTRYVNGAATTGNNDGSSWADAHRGPDAVARALDAAMPGDEIWVATGTYFPVAGPRSNTHRLRRNVALYGGFVGTEIQRNQRDWIANRTILSGDVNVPQVAADNSFHVAAAVDVDATAVLDGFTLTAGNADGGPGFEDRGGGMLCYLGTGPTVRNCAFVGNAALHDGGGAFVANCVARFTDVSFENNHTAQGGGGAMRCYSGEVYLDRCTFVGNSAPGGSALGIEYTGGHVVNCLFHDNHAGADGGALLLGVGDELSVRNVTVVGNRSSAPVCAGVRVVGSTRLIVNCIVWGNTGPGGQQGSAYQVEAALVRYSIVQGGYGGIGNLSSDPMFTSPGAGDFSLTIASPAVDAGDRGAVPAGIILDLARRPRFTDEPTVPDTGTAAVLNVDIGAFELPVPTVATYCLGDGSLVPCPCGNNVPLLTEAGCLNSLGVGGVLAATGTARVSNDSLVLLGSGMPDSACLYFQGTARVASGAGAPFGDGLRCVGGTNVRLGSKTNAGGASNYPDAGDPAVHVIGHVAGPGLRMYQVWYRNEASYCTPATFNLTSALEVAWEL